MADSVLTGIQALTVKLEKTNTETNNAMAMQIKQNDEMLKKMQDTAISAGKNLEDNKEFKDLQQQQKKDELAFRKANATSPAALNEIKKEEAKEFGGYFERYLGKDSKLGKGLDGIAEGLGAKVKGTLLSALKTGALVAFLGALGSFLRSDAFKKMKETIIPKIAAALESFVAGAQEFGADFLAFVENPTFSNFKEMFTGDSSTFLLALGGITALLNPLKSLRLLRLAVTGLVAGAGSFARGISRLSDKITGGNVDAQGRRLVRDSKGVMRVAKGQKGGGQISSRKALAPKQFAKIGKGLLKGGSKFIPGVGLAIAAGIAIYDGIGAGIREFKETGDFGESVKSGIAGAASSLTFGLVTEETFKSGLDSIESSFIAMKDGVVNGFTTAKDGLVRFVNNPVGTLTAMKDSITGSISSAAEAVSNKFTEVTGVKLPTFDEVKTNLQDKLSRLKTSFETATGIELPTFDEVKTNLENKLTSLKTSFETATGIELPTFEDLKTKFTDLKTAITNIELPTMEEIGTFTSDKFTTLKTAIKNIKLPTMEEIGTSLGTTFATIKSSVENFKVPSVEDIKTKFSTFAENVKNIEMPTVSGLGNAFLNMGDSLSAQAEKLTGLSLPDFSDVKNLIEEKFSFKFSDLKLPDFPDLGELITEALRSVMKPIANMKFKIGFGKFSKEFSARKVLPQSFLDFVDKTGSYTPTTTPSRPAENLTMQGRMDRFSAADRQSVNLIAPTAVVTNNQQSVVIARPVTDTSFGGFASAR